MSEKAATVAYVLRVVGIIPTDYGVTSEAIFGPFATSVEASDWLTMEKRSAWQVVQAPQVLPLTPPQQKDQSPDHAWESASLGSSNCGICGRPAHKHSGDQS